MLRILILIFSIAIARPASLCAADKTGAADKTVVPRVAFQKLSVFPASLSLNSRRSSVSLIVTGHDEAGTAIDVTDLAILKSDDANLVRLEANRATPLQNGSTKITVALGDLTVDVPVTIRLRDSDAVSMRLEVLPVLSRQGCSSGACHGSPKGKGGFRLSLRAFDPGIDESTLRNEFFARRTNPLNPDTSLLLRKPLTEVPHAGGRKLIAGSIQHQVLKNWIKEGTRLDPPDAIHCESIQLFPPSGRELTAAAGTQRYAVFATYSDHTVRDVTDLAVFTVSDSSIATADGSGLVTRVEGSRGQTAITVRYLEHMATSFVVSVSEVDGYEWTKPAEVNYVDRLVHGRLRQLQYLPSERCSDSEFIRRVSLDVTGLLPTVEATREFLADSASDKRSQLIDQLLKRPEHAKFMALKWGDALRIRAANISSPGVFKYHRWLVRAFERNLPYDTFARELLTSSGSTFESPPANYFRTAASTNDCTESTAQVFLGARLECAKCHNHPHERWTQDNYYGLGSFFHRVQRDVTDRKDEMFVSVIDRGEVTQPRTGQTMKPWLPGTGEVDLVSGVDRRTVLVDWLTKPDNPLFARVEVNRLWSQMMGRGIVEPIDDFRDSNPPSNSELLDALAADFVKHKFDRRHILRVILNSETYQRSSESIPGNAGDDRYFSRYQRRLLSAEQLLDAICDATSVSEQFGGLPAGTRATQLPSPDFSQEFLKVFGQPERKSVCRCERSEDLNLSQALQVANGSFVQSRLTNGNNRIRQLRKADKSLREIVEECYLAAYSRPPTSDEVEKIERFVEQKRDGAAEEPFEDVLWALLNSNEFLFQH
ncbi:MAG: DUF1553 domain-containing protein [Planctomycetota bacterium]|nr:DUF1553 domain-containing protein [Planctomycetota bacterium]MDA1247994.1 DUF1553 domain-containing protein [Planctomycetota bacterium]